MRLNINKQREESLFEKGNQNQITNQQLEIKTLSRRLLEEVRLLGLRSLPEFKTFNFHLAS